MVSNKLKMRCFCKSTVTVTDKSVPIAAAGFTAVKFEISPYMEPKLRNHRLNIKKNQLITYCEMN